MKTDWLLMAKTSAIVSTRTKSASQHKDCRGENIFYLNLFIVTNIFRTCTCESFIIFLLSHTYFSRHKTHFPCWTLISVGFRGENSDQGRLFDNNQYY